MSYGNDEIFPTPKPSAMFSFTTTVASSLSSPPPKDVSPPAERKIFSPTKELLPLYFSYLERFQFAEASRVLALAARAMDHVWILLPHLQLFAACESIYHSLIFLEAFQTNKYMETVYGEVKSRIESVYGTWSKQVAEVIKSRPRSSTAVDPATLRYDAATQFFCQLLQDFIVYIDCRLKLVDLRLNLHKGAINTTPAQLKQSLAVLGGIAIHLPLVRHPLLMQLAENMSIEVIVYQKLLQTELHIANFEEKKAIFAFQSLDLELQACRSKYIFLKDKTESSAFLDTALYHWSMSFRDQLSAKMELLFAEYRTLKSAVPKVEEEGQSAGAELLLHEKIVEFAVQSSCFNVSLVLRPADGKGNGKHSWVPIYTFPQAEAPFQHWPNIISLYQDHTDILDSTSASPAPIHKAFATPVAMPIASPAAIPASAAPPSLASGTDPNSIPLPILHYFDTHVRTTYYMATLQPKLLLVVIFTGERQAEDPEVTRFMKGLYGRLKYSHLLQNTLAKAANSASPAPASSSES